MRLHAGDVVKHFKRETLSQEEQENQTQNKNIDLSFWRIRKMNNLNILKQIFDVCIVPLIAILTSYLISYIQVQKEQLKKKTDNELLNKYIDMAANTIADCVTTTNQTYVEALKKEGKFDEEAQKVAFQKTLNAVLALLTKEAKDYLTEAYGDLNLYLTNKIESTVNEKKTSK